MIEIYKHTHMFLVQHIICEVHKTIRSVHLIYHGDTYHKNVNTVFFVPH